MRFTCGVSSGVTILGWSDWGFVPYLYRPRRRGQQMESWWQQCQTLWQPQVSGEVVFPSTAFELLQLLCLLDVCNLNCEESLVNL
jgi:hypothetical protein